MTILRESPWYAEILEEGRKEGREEGREEERRHAIQQVLSIRFGGRAACPCAPVGPPQQRRPGAVVPGRADRTMLEAFLALLPDVQPQQ
ncbi:MAG: hypothetical protein HC914_03160 [Chloroflexaceae bacterium]|nr:hypothetical protein [Chloroflexaceae bacterium]